MRRFGHDASDITFRYRKRKQISVYGHTPGLEYRGQRHRYTSAPASGHVAQVNNAEYRALRHEEEYDPGSPLYDVPGPRYRPTDPMQNEQMPATPPLEFSALPGSSPPVEPEIDLGRPRRLPAAELLARFRAIEEYVHSVQSVNAVQQVFEETALRDAIGTLDRIFSGEDRPSLAELPLGAVRQAAEEAISTINYLVGGSPATEEGPILGIDAVVAENLDALHGGALEAAHGLHEVDDAASCHSSLQFGAAPEVDAFGASTGMTLDLLAHDPFQQQSQLEDVVASGFAELAAPHSMYPDEMMDPYGMWPTPFGPPGMHMGPIGPMPPGLGPM